MDSIIIRRMWDMAVCLHNAEPCSFSTLFCEAMVTHVTARDVSMTRQRNSKIMWHLLYKSSSFARTNFNIHSETSASGLNHFSNYFPGFRVTRMSCDDCHWSGN